MKQHDELHDLNDRASLIAVAFVALSGVLFFGMLAIGLVSVL